MDEKKTDKNFGYALGRLIGQIFVLSAASCLIAIMVAMTVRCVMWMF